MLLVSTQVVPEIVVYPDTGGTLAMTGPAEGLAFPAGTDVPYRGEAARAFTAAVERDGG